MNSFKDIVFLYKFARKELGLNRLKSIRASLRGNVTIMRNSDGTLPLNIPNASQTYYAYHQNCKYLSAMGAWLKATSPGSLGTPNMQIQIEQSYISPTTEGTSDSNWVIGTNVPDVITSLNDSNAHLVALQLVPMSKYRVKITTATGNPSDCQLLMVIFEQELIS